MTLQILWFWILCLLWTGYFVLEGFDFGVGMLLPVLGQKERDRETLFETIGPFWDGNEVWLLVAGGATFAAFPQWYATMFSGLLPRAAAHSRAPDRPRSLLRVARAIGEPALADDLDVGEHDRLRRRPADLGNCAREPPLRHADRRERELHRLVQRPLLVVLGARRGRPRAPLRIPRRRVPHASHGRGAPRARASGRGSPRAARVVAGAGFLVATLWVGIDRNDQSAFPGVVVVALAAVAVVAAVVLTRAGRLGAAFAATAATIVLAVATLFTMLYPRVMVSSSNFAHSLTIDNAASGHYTLTVMTVAVVLLLPIVLLYQAWTYHVFRARVGNGGPVRSPAELLGPKRDRTQPGDRRCSAAPEARRRSDVPAPG